MHAIPVACKNRFDMSDKQFDKPRLAIGSVGWTHKKWSQDYYPEDMPAEWQLDFYSHHFPCILMQPDEWLTASERQIRQWSEDVKDTFDFFINVTDKLDDKVIAQLENITQHLGDKLKGVVIASTAQPCDKDDVDKLSALTQLHMDADELTEATQGLPQCWRAHRQISDAMIGFIEPEYTQNIREMRAQMEDFLQQSSDSLRYLFFDGASTDPGRMQEAQVIYQLIS